MKENKFRVYCEFEVNGELHKSMESPASWFLLTQTGKLWTYDPGEAPRPLEKEYKKAIPLFYTGLKDKDGKEIYEGDIVAIEDHVNHIVGFKDGRFVWENLRPYIPIYGNLEKYLCEIIGNIYENPELLNNIA